MHIWLSQSLDISKFNCLHIPSWILMSCFYSQCCGLIRVICKPRNFRGWELFLFCSQLESLHSMCSNLSKVKRFLENNFKKVSFFPQVNRKKAGFLGFFGHKFFLIFFVFLWKKVVFSIRDGQKTDSVTHFTPPIFDKRHPNHSTMIRISPPWFGFWHTPPVPNTPSNSVIFIRARARV